MGEVTAATPFEIMWRLSLAEVSYLIVQALRKAGVKGIGKPTRAFEAAERFEQIIAKSLKTKAKV